METTTNENQDDRRIPEWRTKFHFAKNTGHTESFETVIVEAPPEPAMLARPRRFRIVQRISLTANIYWAILMAYFVYEVEQAEFSGRFSAVWRTSSVINLVFDILIFKGWLCKRRPYGCSLTLYGCCVTELVIETILVMRGIWKQYHLVATLVYVTFSITLFTCLLRVALFFLCLHLTIQTRVGPLVVYHSAPKNRNDNIRQEIEAEVAKEEAKEAAILSRIERGERKKSTGERGERKQSNPVPVP